MRARRASRSSGLVGTARRASLRTAPAIVVHRASHSAGLPKIVRHGRHLIDLVTAVRRASHSNVAVTGLGRVRHSTAPVTRVHHAKHSIAEATGQRLVSHSTVVVIGLHRANRLMDLATRVHRASRLIAEVTGRLRASHLASPTVLHRGVKILRVVIGTGASSSRSRLADAMTPARAKEAGRVGSAASDHLRSQDLVSLVFQSREPRAGRFARLREAKAPSRSVAALAERSLALEDPAEPSPVARVEDSVRRSSVVRSLAPNRAALNSAQRSLAQRSPLASLRGRAVRGHRGPRVTQRHERRQHASANNR